MIKEELYTQYLAYLLQGDRHNCRRIVRHLLDHNIDKKELYVDLFQKSLYDVGRLWEYNKISVAIEHIATSITESMISLSFPSLLAAEHNGKRSVVGCTPGEYHQVGARIVADYFELSGWDSYFLGSNTPDDVLISYLKEYRPDVLAISLSVFFNLNSLVMLVNKVHDKFPGLTVFLGGQAFKWGGEEQFSGIENTYVIQSLYDLEQKLLKF